ncbi:BspA family leucine-rich repeat surface protein [Actinotignum sanguinis]|uniref:BspA family leucine-rich repeat surface protein n=1 Tax=Actinotignum sanguinis TaxID=1445614 RepID=UPI00237E0C0D|nr:BspA family leucine-rich repeat surface protein [Actinotignum sanguinis]MDE1566536.1 BspA family leucine-rich repeat surface protein [Actinotignum sanguinis]MDE1578179.1 BspA family leucine-rich repeat surface protein [Actinotignum sanguinis]MDE1643183.1 BspA family leucine-rich repeat surface protein [Actinotignum sanguinis]
MLKIRKRAAAVTVTLAVICGGGLASASFASEISPNATDGSTDYSAPVGEHLTATWDVLSETLTVSGYGELNREQWLTVKKPHCENNTAPAKRIIFSPDADKTISFPQHSSSLFALCAAADIQLPENGIDTSKATTMMAMFNGAAKANPNVTNWDTRNVTDMNSMFLHATSADPDVSRWNTGRVTDMHSMFRDATSANPAVTTWDTSNVTNMSDMFYQATHANPDVTAWKTGNVTTMANMFWSAESATPNVTKGLVKFFV